MNRIEEFYAGKVILLTGSTGLVGKLVLERVLHRLTDISKIYLLIRPKTRAGGSTVSSEDRLWQEIFTSQVFDQLREQLGKSFEELFREKVAAVPGDLSLDYMGLDGETYRWLQQEAQVIINCAAIVSFDAPIDAALQMNVLGPKRLLDFARGGTNPVLVHVSTCYVNSLRKGPVFEEPLDPRRTIGHVNGLRQKPYDVEEEIAAIMAEAGKIRTPAKAIRDEGQPSGRAGNDRRARTELEKSDHRLSEMGMRWAQSRGWHDVYSFTKAMGEQFLVRHRGDVRAVIIRPAIIESAWQVPIPGWLNGYRMVDPLIVAYGKGRMVDFPGNIEGILDIIPVDVVANALLAITARAATAPGPMVYQVASGMERPLIVRDFAEHVDDYFQKHPLNGTPGDDDNVKPLKKPTFPPTKRFMRRLKYRYVLPATILMALATTLPFSRRARKLKIRYKARLLALDRLRHYARLYGSYGESECTFMTSHTRAVWESLPPENQRDFNFDISQLNWRQYLQEIHIPGIKKFLLGMTEGSRAPAPQGRMRPATGAPENGSSAEARETMPASEGRKIDSPASGGAAGQAEAGHLQNPSLADSLFRSLNTPENVDYWTDLKLLDRAVRKVAWASIGLGFRYWIQLECEGLENIPPKGSFIVASNHSSHMDTAVVFRALETRSDDMCVAAAADYFFEKRWLAWFVHAVFRAVPFDRQGPMTDGLVLSLGILNKGHPLIFFPEGGRSRSGEIQPFKAGIGVLAVASGAPVVPARIEGTFESWPKGNSFPRRSRVTVRFGPPIRARTGQEGIGGRGLSELCRSFTSEVQKAVEALDGSR